MPTRPGRRQKLIKMISNKDDIAREFPDVLIKNGMQIECWDTGLTIWNGENLCTLVLLDVDGNHVDYNDVGTTDYVRFFGRRFQSGREGRSTMGQYLADLLDR